MHRRWDGVLALVHSLSKVGVSLQQQQLKWEPLVIVDFARLARIDRNANPARRIIQNQQLESVSEFPKLCWMRGIGASLSWTSSHMQRARTESQIRWDCSRQIFLAVYIGNSPFVKIWICSAANDCCWSGADAAPSCTGWQAFALWQFESPLAGARTRNYIDLEKRYRDVKTLFKFCIASVFYRHS